MPELIYPFLLKCCEFTTDTFWHYVFTEIAYGRVPTGTCIIKHFLCCSYKGREFSYYLSANTDPKTQFEDIKNLLQNKLNILSFKEKERKRAEFQKIEEELKLKRQKWVDIKKKSIKEILLEQYILKLKKQYKLTFKETKFFLSLIILSLTFKIISSKDIIYEDEVIKNINGIEIINKEIFIKKKNLTEIFINLIPNYETSDDIDDKKPFIKIWKKHLKKINNNYNIIQSCDN